MTEANDALSKQMENFEKDCCYQTVELLKENVAHRTERVVSGDGRLCVRKYLPLDSIDEQLFYELKEISNSHLAQVVDCYELGSNLVLVTEYVEGVSLETLVRETGPLTPAQSEKLMADMSDALRALHNARSGTIVHRDVKPSNIIVSQRGAVLIDYDIARKWTASTEQDTRIWGTNGYAAPEQFGFRQTDARSDVYAMGVVLRFMLTGKEPQEKAYLEPGKLKDLIDFSMSMDPENRPQTVDDFQQKLSRAVSRLDAAASKVVLLPSEPAPSSKRLTLRHFAWRAWQVVMTAWCGVLFVCLLVVVLGFAPLSADSTITSDMYIPILIFFVVVPWLLCCDGFGILERITWFRENRLLKVLGLTFVSIVLSFTFAYLIQWFHMSL